MIILQVEITNLPEFARTYNRAVAEMGRACYLGVRDGCREGVAEMLATRTWKDKTGVTRGETRGYVTEHLGDEGAKGVMECAVPHASYLDSGTAPHAIVARRAKALRWYDSGGNPVFRKSVQHPGTRGDGFFGRGVQKCERVMIREIELGIPRAQRILDG
jgi:hypothetical protein